MENLKDIQIDVGRIRKIPKRQIVEFLIYFLKMLENQLNDQRLLKKKYFGQQIHYAGLREIDWDMEKTITSAMNVVKFIGEGLYLDCSKKTVWGYSIAERLQGEFSFDLEQSSKAFVGKQKAEWIFFLSLVVLSSQVFEEFVSINDVCLMYTGIPNEELKKIKNTKTLLPVIKQYKTKLALFKH